MFHSFIAFLYLKLMKGSSMDACLCSEREMSHHYCGNCQELTGGGAVEDRSPVAMAPRGAQQVLIFP